jgi:hypothetical protein
MKPLPDLNDATAMAARGRRSVLMQARKEALEEIRDRVTAVNSDDVGAMHENARKIGDLSAALVRISDLWIEQ